MSTLSLGCVTRRDGGQEGDIRAGAEARGLFGGMGRVNGWMGFGKHKRAEEESYWTYNSQLEVGYLVFQLLDLGGQLLGLLHVVPLGLAFGVEDL